MDLIGFLYYYVLLALVTKGFGVVDWLSLLEFLGIACCGVLVGEHRGLAREASWDRSGWRFQELCRAKAACFVFGFRGFNGKWQKESKGPFRV